MPSKFIHLHVHSHYSLLNALPKIPELVKEAKKNEMSALALTDNANLYGAIEFTKPAKKKISNRLSGRICMWLPALEMTNKVE